FKIMFYILFFLIILSNAEVYSKTRIALQPLGTVDKYIIDSAVAGITNLYKVDVTVLKKAELPADAYYEPRKRYRAGKLLDFLDENTDAKYSKIVGLTTKDISTIKGEYYDWGILGMGSLGGRACVVSTFRLKRKVSKNKMLERLVKVVNHELGHTFGLEHCPEKNCLMQDAKGTVKTVDREQNVFCDSCKLKLLNLLK
ncbi:MAG: hypothetical protein KKH98_10370, partial [Spirochaetes bacterium]|nr:hypothetical protein [Spirochaetota bacterium]